MKKHIFLVVLFFSSTTMLLAQSSGPLTAPEGTKHGLITMAIIFTAVFLIAFVLYKKKRTEEKK
jgi:hypothetical protein